MFLKKEECSSSSSSSEEEEEEEKKEEAMACPSFRSMSATAQDPPFHSSPATGVGVDGDDERRRSSSDFEFSPHITRNSPAHRLPYPVFGEEKILKAAESSESDSGDEDLDGALPNTPCAKVFNKCRSMGSGLGLPRTWRFRNLVVGRSRSDGKDKFSPLRRMHRVPARKTAEVAEKEKTKEGARRRTSFLPYRTELVALFPPSRRSRPFF